VKNKVKKNIVLIAVTLFLVFCGGSGEKTADLAHPDEHEGQLQGEEAHAHPASEPEKADHKHPDLKLSPEKQKAWGIETGEVSKEKIASQLTLPGTLNLNQNRTAQITSFVPGKVMTLSVDLGDRVVRGGVLVAINSPEFAQAQADFLQARANLNLSRIEYERARKLFEKNVIGEKEYLRREAEYQKASTEYGTYGSLLHSYGIPHKKIDEFLKRCDEAAKRGELCELANPIQTITSPINGTVIYRNVIVGEHIEPEKILFTVSDLNNLWAILDAYEKDLPFITETSKVQILSSLYPEKKFDGKITYISDLIDEKLRTAKVRVEMKNEEGLLKPNMYIQGIIENVSLQRDVLSIPEEAVQNLDGEKIVFIVEEEDVFSVRHVSLGAKIGLNRIVTAGLKEGEGIVIKGAFQLKAELNKATFGHVH